MSTGGSWPDESWLGEDPSSAITSLLLRCSLSSSSSSGDIWNSFFHAFIFPCAQDCVGLDVRDWVKCTQQCLVYFLFFNVVCCLLKMLILLSHVQYLLMCGLLVVRPTVCPKLNFLRFLLEHRYWEHSSRLTVTPYLFIALRSKHSIAYIFLKNITKI